MGGPDDVDAAVAAAKAAFETFSLTSKDERLALLDSIIEVYAGRMEELGRDHQPGDGRAAVAGAGGPGRAPASATSRRPAPCSPTSSSSRPMGDHAARAGADRRRAG